MAVILEVDDIRIYVMKVGRGHYYSLTSMLQAGFSKVRVGDWLRTKKTIEMLGVWEEEQNKNFNYGEFAVVRDWAHGRGPRISNWE